MTDLVGVLQDSVALHHNSESSTLCQIRPLKRVTTVYCPSQPFDKQPLSIPQTAFFFFFFLASAAAVCVLCWKKIINRVNSDRAGSPPRRPATLRLLPCVSTSLPQSVASLELKFFYFPVVCLCRELSGVPSAEGSGPWFSLAKCSASLPSKPDLETCLLSTHGESSLKFHGT